MKYLNAVLRVVAIDEEHQDEAIDFEFSREQYHKITDMLDTWTKYFVKDWEMEGNCYWIELNTEHLNFEVITEIEEVMNKGLSSLYKVKVEVDTENNILPFESAGEI